MVVVVVLVMVLPVMGGGGDGSCGESGGSWPQTGRTGPANYLSFIISHAASTPWMTTLWTWKRTSRKSRQDGG